MKLKSVSAQNLKGQSFELTLYGVNVIVGDNDEGKTSRLDAIKIFCQGEHPRYGKTGTFDLCSGGKELVISGSLADGRMGSHIWQGPKTSQQSFPGDFNVSKVMLDFNNFLSLSGPAKTKYIFDQIDLAKAGFSDEQVTAELKKNVKVETPTDVTEKELNDIVDEVMVLAKARDEEGASIQTWMEMVVQTVKTRADNASAVVDQMAGAAKAALQTQKATTSRPKHVIDSDLEAARALFQSCDTEASKLRDARDKYEAPGKRKVQLQGFIDAIPDRSQEITDLKTVIAELDAKVGAFKSKTQDINNRITPMSNQIAACKADITNATKRLTEAEKKRDTDLAAECCPHCHANQDGWKATLEQEHNTTIATLTQAKMDAETLLKQLNEQVEPMQKELADSGAADNQNALDVADLRKLRAQLKEIEPKQNERAGMIAELAGLKTAAGEAPDLSQLPMLEEQAGAQRVRISELEKEQQQAIAAATNALNEAKQKKLREEHEQKLEVAKLALKTLKKMQSDMASKAITTLVGIARQFTDGILPTPLEFNVKENEFGRWQGSDWIPIRIFGGAYELIAFAGLSVALAQQDTTKIVLMDELGRLTHDNRIKFMQRMVELEKAGVIDHFVGVDVNPNNYSGIVGVFLHFVSRK